MHNNCLADRLFEKAFDQPRDPRSQAYKDGVWGGLVYRLDGWRPSIPYAPGTAELDAYYAGNQEGLRIADDHKRSAAVA